MIGLFLYKLSCKIYMYFCSKYFESSVSNGKYKIVEVNQPLPNPGLRNVFSKNRQDLTYKYPLEAKNKKELLGKEIDILDGGTSCYTFRRNLERRDLPYGSNAIEAGGGICARVLLDGEEIWLDTSGLTFKRIK